MRVYAQIVAGLSDVSPPTHPRGPYCAFARFAVEMT